GGFPGADAQRDQRVRTQHAAVRGNGAAPDLHAIHIEEQVPAGLIAHADHMVPAGIIDRHEAATGGKSGARRVADEETESARRTGTVIKNELFTAVAVSKSNDGIAAIPEAEQRAPCLHGKFGVSAVGHRKIDRGGTAAGKTIVAA